MKKPYLIKKTKRKVHNPSLNETINKIAYNNLAGVKYHFDYYMKGSDTITKPLIGNKDNKCYPSIDSMRLIRKHLYRTNSPLLKEFEITLKETKDNYYRFTGQSTTEEPYIRKYIREIKNENGS